MSVISFSVDEQIKTGVESLAKAESRSKSDLFREMYKTYAFNQKLKQVQSLGKEKFLALGIESIDQAEDFLG